MGFAPHRYGHARLYDPSACAVQPDVQSSAPVNTVLLPAPWSVSFFVVLKAKICTASRYTPAAIEIVTSLATFAAFARFTPRWIVRTGLEAVPAFESFPLGLT